ncbi:protein toll [Anabrus simplex]|uniref:protein toll n=1 Tax=Anabrus simplex TaxID=316456 RepID=UPI0035A3D147
MPTCSRTMKLILPGVLLAVLLSQTTALYKCQSNAHCVCGWASGNRRDLMCPKFSIQEEPTLKLQVWPERAFLWCSDSQEVHYEWLTGNLIGHIGRFTINSCSPPNGSVTDLLTTLGIEDVSTLTLQAIKGENVLTRQSLQDLSSIRVLEIDGFENLTLSDNTFSDLANLTELYIKDNNVTLPVNVFHNLKNLKRLELTNLNLMYLEPGIFQDLTNLKLLNVWGNTLHNLTRETFTGLSNLQSLGLHNNDISFLPEDVFGELNKLKNLSVYGNNFIFLPQRLFAATQGLEQLKLHSNRNHNASVSLPGGLLANLSALKEVYLHECNITDLPQDLIWGSANISVLKLSSNSIRNIPATFFKDAKNLKELYLNHNKLKNLPENVFIALEQLEILHLDHNQLTSLTDPILQGLLNLKVLSVNNNALEHIDAETFRSTRNLLEAYMANNRISFSMSFEDFFGRWSPLQHCVDLQVLHLANNSITEIHADWRTTLTNLYSLDLRNNYIEKLEARELHFVSPNLTVDLRHNHIKTIQMMYIESIARGQGSLLDPKNHNVTIKLDSNPLQCDCNIYHFLKYLENRLSPTVYQLMNLVADNLQCAGPPQKAGMSVKELRSRTITCDRKVDCPEPCSCSFRLEDRAIIVDCRGRRLRNIPPAVPKAAKVELMLNNNFIHHLPLTLHESYVNISRLILSNNNITWLSKESLPPNLKELYLDNNNLTHLNSSLFDMWTNKTNLTLHGNPWMCDCDSLDLYNFLQTSFKQVEYLNNITCQDGRPLARMTAKDICPLLNSMVVALSIVIAIVGITMGILAAVYFRYQSEVKIWLYAHNMCLWFVTEEELDKDKIYDAFVSYSHKDEDFVTNKLLPGLENGPTRFKLCVHYRDWIAGEFITTQITRSVQESRRTLVVLSPNFIKSEWGRLEFRAAHKQALSEGRARVIVVIYGELGSINDMDSELQAYLTTNTYVKWGDPWFWDKLRYALPHPPKAFKSNQINNQIQTSKDDKIELVNPSTPPPAVTTPPADIVVNPLEVKKNGYINHDCDKILAEESLFMNGAVKYGNGKTTEGRESLTSKHVLATLIVQCCLVEAHPLQATLPESFPVMELLSTHHCCFMMYIVVACALLAMKGAAYGHLHCGPADCTCGPDSYDQYEVDCPKSNHRSNVALLKIQYLPRVSVTFVCTTRNIDYRWLQGLKFGQVSSVSFTTCPLPDQSISKLLSSMNITNVSTITFQSNMDLNDILTKEHLLGLNSTSTLVLSLNGLSSLPKGIFNTMKNLTALDLHSNNIHLQPYIFYNTSKLTSLNLAMNNLNHLNQDIFEHLTGLETLNLMGNNLQNISKIMFTGLHNLISLDLSSNHISSVSFDAFYSLQKVTTLLLSWNNIATLPEGLFSTNTFLEVIKLNNNKRLSSLPESLLANLTALKDADFQNCNISELPENLFWGSPNISKLQLSNNILTILPQSLFKDARNLVELHLSNNKLKTLSDFVFAPLGQLQVLNLDHNRIINITRSMLQGLKNLVYLNLNNNAIHYIHPDALKSTHNLQVLHLSHNHISFNKSEESPMRNCTHLTELDMDYNEITQISPDWQNLTNLQKLNLSHNAIIQLEFQDLYFKSRDITVDLASNQIKTIDLAKAEETVLKVGFPEVNNVDIILHSNPLHCNCQIYDLLRYLEFQIAPEVRAAANIEIGNLVCASPPETVGLPVNMLKSSTLMCSLSEQCPRQCLCLLHAEDRVLTVNCSGQGLKDIPAYLPDQQKISNIELHLDHNLLQSLPETLSRTYSKVIKLSLSHNNISQMRNLTLPLNLQVLRVDNNKLSNIDDETVDFFSKLHTIALNNNPWSCNCEQLYLVQFLHRYPQKVEFLEELKCAEKHDTLLINLSEEKLCSPLHWEVVVASGIAIALAATILGLLAALYLNYQQRIRTKLYACKR